MYRAKVENWGESSFQAEIGEHGFMMDVEGRGIGPVEALLASLCACVGHHVRNFLRQKVAEPVRFTIQASADSTADGSRLGDIDLRIELEPNRLDPHLNDALLAVAGKCKIHNTLKANSTINKTLGILG
jgi:uncharacterized OsmC-like protein